MKWNMKKNVYIVSSKDGKWFATDRNYFTDERKLAVKFSENEAEDIVKSIKTMELVKKAA